ncbi:aldose 1-epimerase family protein [Algoriphagus algorifonticola]|uniref:aldose 1-epimerase family protein n=1 Tax=Algoriphagus algorifonticola TaxID=2593007 RepID=UPI0011A76845|nr:aldose 1-epimerase family protein [Algoriphagus algorifonticola]
MIHQIENSELAVKVNTKGIELSSIHSKSTGIEHIWQGDPSFWNGQAPILFPIIGALKDGKTEYDRKFYKIPKHGIVRNSIKPVLLDKTNESLTFSMRWDEETLLSYPFKFELKVIFSLKGRTLEVLHEVTNHGPETMYFSLGGHPAFNCPIHKGEVYEDYFIKFEEKETDSTWPVLENGLIGKEPLPMLKATNKLQLHANLFDKDALILKNLKSREVSLVSEKNGPVLSMSFQDFDYLGIWAKPKAPYVCIEPWLGIADSIDSDGKLTHKEGMIQLGPQNKSTKKYSVSIH